MGQFPNGQAMSRQVNTGQERVGQAWSSQIRRSWLIRIRTDERKKDRSSQVAKGQDVLVQDKSGQISTGKEDRKSHEYRNVCFYQFFWNLNLLLNFQSTHFVDSKFCQTQQCLRDSTYISMCSIFETKRYFIPMFCEPNICFNS